MSRPSRTSKMSQRPECRLCEVHQTELRLMTQHPQVLKKCTSLLVSLTADLVHELLKVDLSSKNNLNPAMKALIDFHATKIHSKKVHLVKEPLPDIEQTEVLPIDYSSAKQTTKDVGTATLSSIDFDLLETDLTRLFLDP